MSRRWVSRTVTRSGTPAYLAARRLARRPDLANLMIPLLLAVSVITFAGSATAVSDDWRVSRARAEVGADQTFRTEVSAGRLMQVTREVDPEGRYLAAALVQKEGDGLARRLYVDSTRLATVAGWDDSWSDVSVSDLAAQLAPPKDRLTFSGREVALTVSDVSLTSSTDARPRLWLQYVNDDGEQRNADLGELRNRAGEATLVGTTPQCARSCAVEKLFLTGESSSVLDADGHLTLGGVTVDGAPADWGLATPGAWRPARPFPVSLVDAPVVLDAAGGELGVDVYLGQLPQGDGPAPVMVAGIAAITPATTPDVVPAVVVEGTPTPGARQSGGGTALDYDEDVVAGVALNGQAVPTHVVARVRSLPRVGSVGMMADLETSLVEFEPPAGAVLLPELWATDDTPVGRCSTPCVTPGSSSPRWHPSTSGSTRCATTPSAWACGCSSSSAWRRCCWPSTGCSPRRCCSPAGAPTRSLPCASWVSRSAAWSAPPCWSTSPCSASRWCWGWPRRWWRSCWCCRRSAWVRPTSSSRHRTTRVQWPLLALVGAVLFVVATAIALVVSRRTTRLGRPAILRWAEQA